MTTAIEVTIEGECREANQLVNAFRDNLTVAVKLHDEGERIMVKIKTMDVSAEAGSPSLTKYRFLMRSIQG